MQRFSKNIDQKPSPNHSSRRGLEVLCTIIHFDRSPNDTAGRDWLINPVAKASSHFHIARTGKIFQLVDLSQAAWHAGASELKFEGMVLHGVNLFSIGIELANVGPVLQGNSGRFFWEDCGVVRPLKPGTVFQKAALQFSTGHKVESFWEPYPEPQLNALQNLLTELAENGYSKAASNLFGHEEISIPLGRKIDPGPLFPWNQFLRSTPRTVTSSVLL